MFYSKMKKKAKFKNRSKCKTQKAKYLFLNTCVDIQRRYSCMSEVFSIVVKI